MSALSRKYKDISCLECSTVFTPVTGNTKYCVECQVTSSKNYACKQKDYIREYNKKYQEKRTSAYIKVGYIHEKECADCGKKYIATGNRSLRCVGCVDIKGKEHSANWKNKNIDRVNKRATLWNKTTKGRALRASIQKERECRKKKAVPKWINKEEIKYIYRLSGEKGLVVDHIVPLNSKLVCGLHVQDNLRCIPNIMNIKKSNKYWPDMWGAL